MELSLDNGKYKVIMTDDCRAFYALRNNESWRDLTGDNLIYFMALEIEMLRKKVAKYNDGNI